MSTRSGKPYNHGKEPHRKQRSSMTDSIDTAPSSKELNSTVDASEMTHRELRRKKSNPNNSTFDNSNVSGTNNDGSLATESNWVVSDVSDKPKTRSRKNKLSDQNKTTITNGFTENDNENDINMSNIPTKQLKKKKSKVNRNLDKIVQSVDTAYSKDEEKQCYVLNTDIAPTGDKDKAKIPNNAMMSELNEVDNQKDIEVEMSTEISNKQSRKKKKGKGNKKKKQKVKSNMANENDEELNNIVAEIVDNGDKCNISQDSAVGKHTNEKDKDLNTSNSFRKHLRSSKSIGDNTSLKIIDTTYEKDEKRDRTFDKDSDAVSVNTSQSLVNKSDKINNTFEKDDSTSFDTFKRGAKTRHSNVKDLTFDKTNSPVVNITREDLEGDNNILSGSTSKRMSLRRHTMDASNLVVPKLDTTFDKELNNTNESRRKSLRLSVAIEHKLNTTFEKEVSKSSLISSDNSVDSKSEISRISITSDDTVDDIGNTTPVLIESSVDDSRVKDSPKPSPKDVANIQTPLKREGTFTKDEPEIVPQSPQTPGRRSSGVLSVAGCTPFHVGKSSQKKKMLNITHSLEKRMSVDPNPRMTRVMFCSPVDTPAVAAQEKRKVIKSNLKGSNKSFVFDEKASFSRPARKRSYTHNDVDEARVKRTRLAEDLQQSVDRLSRPRTAGGSVKPTETTPKKSNTPYKSRSETKPARTRLPNFAAMHQKQFSKMESLDECQERKAKRARQMLTPTGPTNVLDRVSPKNNTDSPIPAKEPVKKVAVVKVPAIKELAKPKEKPASPKKQLTLESLRPGFTRFGFKLNLDIPNPFSIPPKPNLKEKTNGIIPKPALPSLAGATVDRREVAKRVVMRENSFLKKKRNVSRSENRTIIKGVRTNRRFELQMKLRNID